MINSGWEKGGLEMIYRKKLIPLFTALIACLLTISSVKASADVIKEREKLMKLSLKQIN